VSLVPPPTPAGHLAAGSVTPQDRSRSAREVDRVLDGLVAAVRTPGS
jgi:hypothetical protein